MARGILAYLLSLPDGAREDVRTLADRNPGLGRRGVAKALEELVESGYYVRRTVRDQDSGRVRTETHIFDSPQPVGVPLPVRAGTGQARAGKAGAFPQGKKNPGETPPTRTTQAGTPARRAGEAHPEPDAAMSAEYVLLAGVVRAEPRLTLGIAEVIALAPLAAPWLRSGLSDLEIRALLTSGLPQVVHSPRALLADRLVRKLPVLRAPRDAVAPAASMAECAGCRNPLPRGRTSGVCAACVGTGGATPASVPGAGQRASASERVRALRTTLHAFPPLTAAKVSPPHGRRLLHRVSAAPAGVWAGQDGSM